MSTLEREPDQPSWDAVRSDAPERPRFTGGMTEVQLIARPKRVIYTFAFVALAAMIYTALTAFFALRYEEISEALATSLPTELREDYMDDDLRKAVNVLLGTVLGGSLALCIVQVLSAQTLMLKRKASARILLVISSFAFLPLSIVAGSLGGAGTPDLLARIAVGVLLITAIALVSTPLVTRWLRQSNEPRKHPIIPKMSTE